MEFDRVATTTRSVRKRLDLTRPVPRQLLSECLEVALQAPSASNRQPWHFLFLDDPEPKKVVAAAYRKAFRHYLKETGGVGGAGWDGGDPRAQSQAAVAESAMHLVQVLHRVPVLVLPCIEGSPQGLSEHALAAHYGSILPAAWSLMLALRSRGLASAWTTLHVMYASEVAEALGIPPGWTQACLIPVAYPLGGDFATARRLPVPVVSSWNGWK